MKKILIFLIAPFALMSCEEPYEIRQDAADATVVIEGLLTNNPDYQFIKVSKTADFYGSGHTPRVTDATVTVNDDAGNTITYVHNPRNHEDSAGYYFPADGFVGVIGRTYKLTVDVAGALYEAQDKLLPVTPIDSLTIRLDEEERADPEDAGRFYEVLIFTTEPQDREDFYLFKFYRNDTLTYENDSDIYYSDDKLLAESIDGIAAPSYFALSDDARVEAYSLSRQGYVFYNDLSSLINSDGGMFGPIPATPRTNLNNGAYGFFQVSSITIDNIHVE